MAERYFIVAEGLDGMVNDFKHARTDEPYQHARTRLEAVLKDTFEETQLAVPVGEGDKRRPAGALRDSGRTNSHFSGDFWSGEIAYGTEDDELPYAVWARWKHFHKTGVDYMEATEHNYERFEQAMNSAFDDAFGEN